MRDITFGIEKPSVGDLKIGRITSDPEATPDKVIRQKLKYPPAEIIGFQLMGMRVRQAGRAFFYINKRANCIH